MSDIIEQQIINRCVQLIKKSPIKEQTFGEGLRKVHTMCMVRFFIMILITSNEVLLRRFLIFFSILLLLQLFFKKCIITSIEQELLKDKKTILDIILIKLHLKINSRNRFKLNSFIFTTIILIIILKFKIIRKK
jgi:hypothetical protein